MECSASPTVWPSYRHVCRTQAAERRIIHSAMQQQSPSGCPTASCLELQLDRRGPQGPLPGLLPAVQQRAVSGDPLE